MNINKFQELKSQLDNELQSANLMCIKPFLKVTSKKKLEESIKHFPEWQSQAILQAWNFHRLKKEWFPAAEKLFNSAVEKEQILNTSVGGGCEVLLNPVYSHNGCMVVRVRSAFHSVNENDNGKYIHLAYKVNNNKYTIELAKIERE